jgi:hypothetical protein
MTYREEYGGNEEREKIEGKALWLVKNSFSGLSHVLSTVKNYWKSIDFGWLKFCYAYCARTLSGNQTISSCCLFIISPLTL